MSCPLPESGLPRSWAPPGEVPLFLGSSLLIAISYSQGAAPRELFTYYNKLPRRKLPPKKVPPRELFIYYRKLLPEAAFLRSSLYIIINYPPREKI
jgi:hypothetical protein